MALSERFWGKVVKTDTCWLWTGATAGGGYGDISYKGSKHRAHRLSYEDAIGPIPAGLTLDHLCRVRACVRPSHLEPVTRGENVLRGISAQAANARKTTCPRGHPYDHVRPSGGRRCKRCDRASAYASVRRKVGP